MTLIWMFFGLLLSCCLVGAAWFAEQALRAKNWPIRWPWVTAMVLSILVPVALYVAASFGIIGASEGTTALSSGAGGAVNEIAPGMIATAAQPLASYQSADPIAADLDRIIDVVWSLLSAVVAIRFGAALWTLRRSIHDGKSASYNGQELHFTTETGPAVIGVFQPRIVVPAWFGSLEEDRREMLIRH